MNKRYLLTKDFSMLMIIFIMFVSFFPVQRVWQVIFQVIITALLLLDMLMKERSKKNEKGKKRNTTSRNPD